MVRLLGSVLLLTSVVHTGCVRDSTVLEWSVTYAGVAERPSTQLVARVRRGGCSGPYQPVSDVSAGRVGIEVRAIDTIRCESFAVGCAEVESPPSERVVVTLMAAPLSEMSCTDQDCRRFCAVADAGNDGGLDSGQPQDGGPDAPDGGPDAPDAGAEEPRVLFAAAGSSGQAIGTWDPVGEVWTDGAIPPPEDVATAPPVIAVAIGAGRAVAIRDWERLDARDLVLVSTDGLQWRAAARALVSLAEAGTGFRGANDVVYCDALGEFWFLDRSGVVWSSPDGDTPGITRRLSLPADDRFRAGARSIACEGRTLVVVGSLGVRYSSLDGGETWMNRQGGPPGDFENVFWVGDRFVAVGVGGRAASSADGVTWIDVAASSELDGPRFWVAATGTRLYAGGAASDDGGASWARTFINAGCYRDAVQIPSGEVYGVHACGDPDPFRQFRPADMSLVRVLRGGAAIDEFLGSVAYGRLRVAPD